MRRLTMIWLGAALVVCGACGDDDDGASVMPSLPAPEWEHTDDLTVEAHDAAGDQRADLEFTLTNVDETPLAVVDPAQDTDRNDLLDDGGVQVAYLAVEGAAGSSGEPAPNGEGVLLEPGASHSGTAQALTRGGVDLPVEVELCVEVVARFDADDDGDGRVTFPARPADDPPTMACSESFTAG